MNLQITIGAYNQIFNHWLALKGYCIAHHHLFELILKEFKITQDKQIYFK